MRFSLFALLGLTFLSLSLPLSACTGIRIKPQDGSVVAARTLEFAVDIQSNIIFVPRGHEYQGTTPEGSEGIKWTTKYAAVGATPFDLPQILDGFNEKGLGIGLFYFPGYAKYNEDDEDDHDESLAPWELGTYLLTQFASVEEVKEAVKDISVIPVVLEQFGFVPPIHYIVNDSSGNSLVLEHVDGELHVHDNPLGVMSNSPEFDWHMTNLRNYVNLRVSDVPPREIDGEDFSPLGIGSGMLGLPGDFTPPSRMVRAAAFSHSALPVATATEGVFQAFHILNQFDIPKGIAREELENGQPVADYTIWTSASDLTNGKYYFHTFENRCIRMVDLNEQDLDANELIWFSMAGDEQVVPAPLMKEKS